MNIRDIVNEVRRISRIKDKSMEDVICSHPIRRREGYRPGLYKCWECGKIIDEPVNIQVDTPVEWLEKMVIGMIDNGGDLGDDYPALMEHIKKAKEMEKQRDGNY